MVTLPLFKRSGVPNISASDVTEKEEARKEVRGLAERIAAAWL